MATTTQSRLREMLARTIAFYYGGTATGGSTTTVADTSADTFDALDDDVTTGMWAHIIADAAGGGAAPTNESRKVSSISTTTATVDTAYSAATASGDTYELLPYHHRDMNDALYQALRTIGPFLYLPLRNETITLDDRLSNGTFEAGGADAFTGWTKTAGTWTEEATIIFEGERSARGVASGADAQLTQAWQGDISEVAGQTATFRLHMQALATSVARVGIDFGNSIAVEYSSYHSGKSAGTGAAQWEPLEVSVAVPAEASTIVCIAEITDGNTGYVDWGGGLQVGTISRYTIPTAFVNGPARIFQQWDQNEPNGRYIPVTPGNPWRAGRLLRLEGEGALTVPSADTGTTEISEAQAEMVVTLAAYYLFRRLSNTGFDRDAHQTRSQGYFAEYQRMQALPGNRMRPMSAHDPRGMWRFSADSSGRYLIPVR